MNYRKIFEQIIQDSRYKENIEWGEPRPGHPEGTIKYHIQELEQNLELINPASPYYWQLKILIHVHDTFKKASERVPIIHPNSHASLAVTFLQEFCPDQGLINIVQYHDEPYAIWRSKANEEKKLERLKSLKDKIQDMILFKVFCYIDNNTIGKSREPFDWFIERIDRM